MSIYVEYSNIRIKSILEGRPPSAGKSRIPGIDDFHRMVNSINKIAYASGCPFAAEHMYDIEKLLEEFRTALERENSKVLVITRDSLIQAEDRPKIRVDIDAYSGLVSSFIEGLARYDRYMDELFKARVSGYYTYREVRIAANHLENRIRKLLVRPFIYNDRGISGFEYEGTLEWRDCVAELRREPANRPYESRYYFVGENKGVAVT